MPPRSPRRPRPWARPRLAGVGLLALAVAGCAEPALPEAPQDEGAQQPVEASAPDPARAALVDQLAQLRATVAAIRDELAGAMDAADAAAARRHGDAAATLLIDTDGGGGRSLFPSTTTERGDLGPDDALTATLTAARDAGGDLGRSTLELLRDPLAGDLGSWQRDPTGVIASVRETTGTRGELATIEAAVFELPGEGTRALAWTLLTADARDRDDAAAYAERGVAHLDIVLLAIDHLLEDAAEGPADDRGGENADDEGGEDADDEGGEDADEPAADTEEDP